MVVDVPFFSQMVNYAGEDSGFPDDVEVGKWQSNCCGIACVRMVVAQVTGQRLGYWETLQHGLRLNAYNDIGWIHKGLVDLAGEYGVAGRAHRGKTVDDLFRSVRAGHLCIASCSAGFRGGLPKPGTNEVFSKGGHLIVAFANEQGEVACHHPSSVLEWNKAAWVVPSEQWERSFSGGFMEFGPGSGRAGG